jgi:hypothetical protein
MRRQRGAELRPSFDRFYSIGGTAMRKLLLSFVVFSIVAVGGARAQMATIRLTAEDTHTIKEIVLKEMNVPKAAAGDFKVGDQAPANAELQPFPAQVSNKVSAIKSHRFFISGQKIVVVDPKDNKIAEIIE